MKQPEAADTALHYLRSLVSIGRTTDLPLAKAFNFRSQDTDRTTRRPRRSSIDPVDIKDDTHVATQLPNKPANESSVFARAEDFWAVVGWAFNCSVRYAKRWERWQVWLELMLDLMTKDLRDRNYTQEASSDKSSAVAMDDALIARYLTFRSNARAEKRRMMRAMLADGSKKSVAEFGPIWRNETRPPRKESDTEALPTKKLDIENDQYGDYDMKDEDDDSELERQAPLHGHIRVLMQANDGDDEESSENDDQYDSSQAESEFGGSAATILRQRLLGLVAEYSTLQRQDFMDLEELFDLYTEFIRPLPLSVFTRIMLPVTPWLDPDAHTALVRMLFRPLLASDAPVCHEEVLDQAALVRYYLPYTASRETLVDNTKVGILLEALLRLLWKHNALESREELKTAFATGCAARREKISLGGRGKSKASLSGDTFARAAFAENEQRMSILIDMIMEDSQ